MSQYFVLPSMLRVTFSVDRYADYEHGWLPFWPFLGPVGCFQCRAFSGPDVPRGPVERDPNYGGVLEIA